MKQPTNPQLSALAMMCVTLIAIVAMLLMSASASAQVGQPYYGKTSEFSLGLTADKTAAYTWQRDVELRNAATNRNIVYVVGGLASATACPPCAAGFGGAMVVDFFVTKRKKRLNANF